MKDFRPDCCIAATNVTIRVLRYFGLEAEPLPVQVKIYSAQARKHVAQAYGERLAVTAEAIIRWSKEDGSWSLGIGYGEKQHGRWAGHLVSLIEKEFMVDASLKQADRAQYGIELPEVLVAPVTEDFLRCEEQLAFESEKGDIMYYRTVPENQGFRAAADWKRDYRKIVGRIIRKVREPLGKHGFSW